MNAIHHIAHRQSLDPVEAMLTLIECLESGMEVPKDIQAWHLQCLKRYRSGEEPTMDDAFGLAVGRGEARRRLPCVWRERERNALIREAAWHLKAEYPTKTQRAKIIENAMAVGVPGVENRDATLLLIKLRNICIKPRSGKPLDIGKRRVQEIMNGDGL